MTDASGSDTTLRLTMLAAAFSILAAEAGAADAEDGDGPLPCRFVMLP